MFLIILNNKMWKNLSNIQNLKLDNSLYETKFEKICLIPYSRMCVISIDTTHNSLQLIYRSAKIDWTKKTIWVNSSSIPTKVGVGTIKWSLDFKAYQVKKIAYISCKQMVTVCEFIFHTIGLNELFLRPERKNPFDLPAISKNYNNQENIF